MLIITGVGRCGTSLAAKFFIEMGFDLGKISWDDNVHAGYEDRDIVTINRCLHKAYIKNKSPMAFYSQYKKRIFTFSLEVVKDPRFTWPGVLPAWWELRKDLKLLIMFRDFDDVVASRQQMNNGGRDLTDTRGYTVGRVRSDFAQFFNFVLVNRIQYRIVLFPDFFDKQADFIQAIIDLGIPILFSKSRDVLNKIIDKKLISISRRGNNEKE